MAPVSYHEFFGGCASVAGALIGLLFVAISVTAARQAARSTGNPSPGADDHDVPA